LILLQGVAFLHRAPGILGDAVQGRWIRHGVTNSNCEFGVIGRRGEEACFAVRYYVRNGAGIRRDYGDSGGKGFEDYARGRFLGCGGDYQKVQIGEDCVYVITPAQEFDW